MLSLVTVTPVDAADQPGYVVLFLVRRFIIFYGIHIYDEIQFRRFAYPHGSAPALQQDFFFRDVSGNHGTGSAFLDLKGTALEKINGVFSAFGNVDGEFRVHRIIVFFLNAAEHPFHLLHQRFVGDQTFAGDEFHIPRPA